MKMSAMSPYPPFLLCFPQAVDPHLKSRRDDSAHFSELLCSRMLSSFCRVQLFVTPWTVARQAPLSTAFFRQEYWHGLPCPPPGLYGPHKKRSQGTVGLVSGRGYMSQPFAHWPPGTCVCMQRPPHLSRILLSTSWIRTCSCIIIEVNLPLGWLTDHRASDFQSGCRITQRQSWLVKSPDGG